MPEHKGFPTPIHVIFTVISSTPAVLFHNPIQVAVKLGSQPANSGEGLKKKEGEVQQQQNYL